MYYCLRSYLGFASVRNRGGRHPKISETRKKRRCFKKESGTVGWSVTPNFERCLLFCAGKNGVSLAKKEDGSISTKCNNDSHSPNSRIIIFFLFSEINVQDIFFKSKWVERYLQWVPTSKERFQTHETLFLCGSWKTTVLVSGQPDELK